MRRPISSLAIVIALAASSAFAQAPATVVVPAADSAPAASVPANAVAVTNDDSNSASLLKTLQEMKAANDDVLQKQAATLSQLDEIEKNADQLRIFTRRS